MKDGLQSLPLRALYLGAFFYGLPACCYRLKGSTGVDLAPKHMAMPLSWKNHFGFVCTPRHQTYRNIKESKVFTVSYPRPDSIVLASLTASPRCGGPEGEKPIVENLSTFSSSVVDGVFLDGGYLFLECELERFVDGFDVNSLIAGNIVAAHIDRQALRISDGDEQQQILEDSASCILVSRKIRLYQ